MKKGHLNIGIVTFPIGEGGNIPLSNLAAILYRLSDRLYVITGNEGKISFKRDGENVHMFNVQHKGGAKSFNRVINYTYTQLKISFMLAKLSRNIDLWIFFIGGEGLVLPMLTAKLLRKNVIVASAGSGFKVAKAQGDPLAKALALLQNINYSLSNGIILYSERLVEEHGLEKYRNKISIACKHFLDFNKFKTKKGFGERENLVGYIGGLSKAKGISNFLEAIPKVIERENRIDFIIGGGGELQGKVKEYLSKQNLYCKVRFAGWIPHNELPEYLNELKLIVLPSYTEGLPNLMLEAMACGTPVLATPVGAIPDTITDGETGFIMEDNSPACIAKNVVRALEHPDLERIAENARVLVGREFTYEAAVERYRKILGGL